MADKKISQLTALSAANLAPSTDVLAIVDTSATETKKIVAQDLVNGVLNVASAVGIGTSSPTEKLTVAGNIKLGTSGTTYLYGPSTTGRSFISNSDSSAYIGLYGSAYGGGADSILSFVAGTTNTMTLNASGNLGLGVTPGIWTVGSAFQLGYAGSVWYDSTSALGNTRISNNIRFNSALQYLQTGAASYYQQGAGAHYWFSYASNSAGAALSGGAGQAMTLDASGGFLVGTTSNPNSYRVIFQGKNTTTSLGGEALLNLFDGNANNEYCNLRFATSSDGPLAVIGAKAVTGGAYPSSVGALEFGVQNGGTTITAMTLDANGRLGIGTSSPGFTVDIEAADAKLGIESTTGTNSVQQRCINTGGTLYAAIDDSAGSSFGATYSANIWYTGNYAMRFATNNTERARIDSSGNLLVGATSQQLSGTTLQVGAYQTSGDFTAKAIGVYYSTVPGFFSNSYDGTYSIASIGINAFDNSDGSASTSSLVNGGYGTAFVDLLSGTGGGIIRFRTGTTERARITSGGDFLVAKTAANIGAAGFQVLNTGQTDVTVSASECMNINRETNDGDLIRFRQANNVEGSISVSGATVSYNAFAGSHWSQLQDGSKPDILRGTVMESINELCVWPDETNERLPKSKVSDTAGSKKVYGVFMAWDNDWTTTNDMYVTAVGAFICRVNGSVTVQEGDLLESNGDGTARVQADDIIRSSTIGKVTSTVKTHEYDDGSYCVPTVLYCG